MKTLFIKDRNRRKLFKINEKNKILLKAIIGNLKISRRTKLLAFKKLISFPRDCSITRIRNRCFLTYRSRAVNRKFKLSRLMFRKYALNGFLIGVKKASW